MLRVAVDIGGTFTDLAAVDDETGEEYFFKASTTADDYTRAIVECLGKLGHEGGAIRDFVHGTTLVINACLERRGARTALISTKGFRDTLEIARGNRTETFNYRFKRHEPLVPRELRVEADERIYSDGSVITPLDEDALRRTLAELQQKGVEAVAICFLHSYKNPAHERRAAEIARSMGDWFVSASSELSGEYREYERSSTVTLNAFVGPKVSRYVADLEAMLADQGVKGRFYLMQSNGGVADPATIKRLPSLLMESGPVGGIAGAVKLGEALGVEDLITFDMGGTTAKAALVRHGVMTFDSIYYVGGYEHGYPLQTSVVDMLEVGAGGGSMAWIDDLGALRVGPRSAGANPGPAAYGLGNEQPTVTDANIHLGRLDPADFRDAGMELDASLSERALTALGAKLGYDSRQMAIAICRLANLTMSAALRRVSIERGYDPRDFAMVACGGNGPLHAAELAEELGCTRIFIPPHPAHFSAFGMLGADARYDASRTWIADLDPAANRVEDLAQTMQSLHAELEATVRSSLGPQADLRFEDYAEMRYKGQDQTVKVRLSDDLSPAVLQQGFDATYVERYGHVSPIPVEIVSLRASCSVPRGIEQTFAARARPAIASQERLREVVAINTGKAASYAIHERRALKTGAPVSGPCLVLDAASTVHVPAGWQAQALANEVLSLTRSSGS